MKKFLVLPIVAALAACSSNDDKVAVPVQAQPVLTASHGSVPTKTPKKETEVPKTKNQQPVVSTPVYAPHTPHYVSSPQLPVQPPVQPLPPVAPQPPVQPMATNISSSPEVTKSTEFFKPTTTSDGKFAFPEEHVAVPQTGSGVPGQSDSGLTENNKDGLKVYEKDNTYIYFFEPAKVGLEYQSFGPVFEGNTLKGYLSTGVRYTPKDDQPINATYKGAAIGTYDNKSEVISAMDAALKWGSADKSLTIKTTGSKILENNQAPNLQPKLVEKSELNLNETLNWDTASKKFVSTDNKVQSYLYGNDSAAEVGGTFDKEIDGKSYKGAFGGSQTIK